MPAISVEWDRELGGTKEFVGERGPWRASDMMASENELFEFLYGLVRLLKPLDCFESGSYHGGATAAIARALRDNGVEGYLVSCDPGEACCAIAREAVKGLPAEIRQRDGESQAASASWDFAFIDGGGCKERIATAKALKLNPGAVVVLHDSRRPSGEKIAEELGWQPFFIPTPRGVTLYRIP